MSQDLHDISLGGESDVFSYFTPNPISIPIGITATESHCYLWESFLSFKLLRTKNIHVNKVGILYTGETRPAVPRTQIQANALWNILEGNE